MQQQQQHETTTTTTATATQRSIYVNCSIVLFWLFVFLLCILLFLLFICHCASTITDAEQQQHETTTTTTESNLYKLLCVQELISPIHIPMYDLPLQQLNMKWANKCSTALGHQMPLLGVCLHLLNCTSSKCQADLVQDCKYQADLT